MAAKPAFCTGNNFQDSPTILTCSLGHHQTWKVPSSRLDCKSRRLVKSNAQRGFRNRQSIQEVKFKLQNLIIDSSAERGYFLRAAGARSLNCKLGATIDSNEDLEENSKRIVLSEKTREILAKMRGTQKVKKTRAGSKNLTNSPETRLKKSLSAKKRRWSPEVKKKMSDSHKGKKRSLECRMKIGLAHLGRTASPLARSKISAGVKAASRKKVKAKKDQRKTSQVDPMVMEKAVLELGGLKREIAAWLRVWYSNHSPLTKPTLEDAAEASPEIYAAFVRYVALMDFVRNTNGPY